MSSNTLQAFKPAYWGGEVYLDHDKEFFAVAGGGQLRYQCRLVHGKTFWHTGLVRYVWLPAGKVVS